MMGEIKTLSFLCVCFLTFLSCKNDNNIIENKKDNTFSDKTFLWKITIPKTYFKLGIKEIDNIKEEGEKLLDKPTNVTFSRTIMGFKRDDLNIFIANYENLSGYDGEFENKMIIKETLIYSKIYKALPNARVDYTIGKDTISNLEFRKAKMIISINDKVILTYIIHSKILKNKLFFTTIMYDNDKNGKIMFDAFKKSTFEK